MRQAVILVGSFLLLSMLSGCATDPVHQAVEDIITGMNNARTQMDSVSDELERVLKLAKANNKKVGKGDLKTVFTGESPPTKSLREVGEKFVKLFDKADLLKSELDATKQKALADAFDGRLKASFRDLNKAYDRLKAAEVEVKDRTVDSETATYVQDNLREALQGFESVTRQK